MTSKRTRRGYVFLGIAAGIAALLPAAAQQLSGTPPSAPPVTPPREIRLFNGRNLEGWYTFFPTQGVDKDPDKIITVEDGGVIRVTGKEFGYFATRRDYKDYHLVFEVKWGEKRWPPRENAVRDSGVLLHAIGPDKVWIKSIECQIQEKDFGDFFHIGGVSSVVDGKRQNGRVVRKTDYEKPRGEWNTVEVICDGDTVINIVNGQVVNTATGVTQGRDGAGEPLNQGKIAFQSEGAEVFYRNIRIKPVGKKQP